jgi:hypothetical protein
MTQVGPYVCQSQRFPDHTRTKRSQRLLIIRTLIRRQSDLVAIVIGDSIGILQIVLSKFRCCLQSVPICDRLPAKLLRFANDAALQLLRRPRIVWVEPGEHLNFSA